MVRKFNGPVNAHLISEQIISTKPGIFEYKPLF